MGLVSVSLLINTRKNQLLTEVSAPAPTPLVKQIESKVNKFEELPAQAQEAHYVETTSEKLLLQGRVINTDIPNKRLTILDEKPNNLGKVTPQEAVAVDIKNLTTYLCWPTTVKTIQGNEIDVTKTYIPVSESSVLMLAQQTESPISEIMNGINQSKYAFVLLEKFSDDKNVLVQAKQLALVGCY